MSLIAATCTWYWPAERPVIVVKVPVPLWVQSSHDPDIPSRYWTELPVRGGLPRSEGADHDTVILPSPPPLLCRGARRNVHAGLVTSYVFLTVSSQSVVMLSAMAEGIRGGKRRPTLPPASTPKACAGPSGGYPPECGRQCAGHVYQSRGARPAAESTLTFRVIITFRPMRFC